MIDAMLVQKIPKGGLQRENMELEETESELLMVACGRRTVRNTFAYCSHGVVDSSMLQTNGTEHLCVLLPRRHRDAMGLFGEPF